MTVKISHTDAIQGFFKEAAATPTTTAAAA
ncbi:hypothetical protein BAY1663_01721 [Pseudomonas sp. BAY1663]|nr:hypothetical protein BAY1663_01721 [Pseudomonas sp. BAY1663]